MDPLQFVVGPEEVVIEMQPSLIYNTAKQRNESENSAQAPFVNADIPLEDGAAVKMQASNPDMPARCWCCKASRLRVVNIEGTGKRMLECANRRCLASIEYTDLPAGTIIEQEKATKKNYGWYLRDTSEMFYPSPSTLQLPPDGKFEYIPEILLDKSKKVVVRCPGQRRLVMLE
ncbi:hypothetical protein Y032_0008g248 [Ancylostoma ceylanicum]|uniref:Uncharacterized protein n=1 Tax=Ancylostoma ceylanicum TaxID=53326 RepID=A0A016VJV9_9BILA|nr:hypothetical protein Y032_0008g248 [Ancylostoma ceylanicum]